MCKKLTNIKFLNRLKKEKKIKLSVQPNIC